MNYNSAKDMARAGRELRAPLLLVQQRGPRVTGQTGSSRPMVAMEGAGGPNLILLPSFPQTK